MKPFHGFTLLLHVMHVYNISLWCMVSMTTSDSVLRPNHAQLLRISWIKCAFFQQASNYWRGDVNKLPKFWGIPKQLTVIPSGEYNKAVKIYAKWLADNLSPWRKMLNTVDKNSACQPSPRKPYFRGRVRSRLPGFHFSNLGKLHNFSELRYLHL